MLRTSMMLLQRFARLLSSFSWIGLLVAILPASLLAQGGGVGGGVGAVPEPGTLALLALGMAGYGYAHRRGH